MALRLSKALNTTPDFRLNLQKNDDVWYAEHETKAWKKVKAVKLSGGAADFQASLGGF